MPKVIELLSQNISNAQRNVETWGGLIINVKDYGAKGDGITDDTAAISKAFNSVGTNQATLTVSPGTYYIGSNLTIPANVRVWFLNGGVFAPKSGVTVTYNGGITADVYQIFGGAGNVAGNLKVPALYPEWFGAKGDGTTDDTAAFTKLYAFASPRALAVELRADRYLLTAGINTENVTTYSYNSSVLDFQVSASTSNYAFRWGGNNVEISGIVFELSNSAGNTNMQGLHNSLNGVKNQRFIKNKVIGKTFRPLDGLGNIYGVWIQGTGISEVFIQDNVFDQVRYAIQFNYQISGGNIITNPMGLPVKSFYINNNNIINSAIGINAPHVYCSNVFVNDNYVNSNIGFNVNIAHTSQFEVCRNILDGSTTVNDGYIHIEDVSYQGKVNENIINVANIGDGIRILLASGVSGDTLVPTQSVEVSKNDIRGSGNATARGIQVADTNSPRVIMEGNRIDSFGFGVSSFSSNVELLGAKFRNCVTCIETTRFTKIVEIEVEACTNIIRSTIANEISGITFINAAPTLDLKPSNISGSNSFIVYRDVKIRLQDFTLTSSTAFALFVLPATRYDFNFYYMISDGGTGAVKAKVNVKHDGTTFTATKTFENVFGALGSATFTNNSGTLNASHFYSSGSTPNARAVISIDDVLYAN